MKTILKVVLGLVALFVLCAGGVYAWASIKDRRLLARNIETHRVGFPIPFPLSADEAAALQPGQDSAQVALANAVARGDHLVHSLYGCVECHGQNFGGGVMIDDPMIGHLLGPNLTTGKGSVTIDFGPSDWDRAVRHGVAPDGHPTAMPSTDFQLMADQELSDIVAYIRSLPPADNTVPAIALGPLGKVLLATGNLPLAADEIPIHTAPHAVYPPAAEATVEFGRHLAGTCSGCHRADFEGGPIAGGDPSWPPALNLTPHADGLAGWTLDEFKTTLRSGNKPDGTPLRMPMASMVPYAQSMTDTEIEALWMFLQQLPPVPSPK